MAIVAISGQIGSGGQGIGREVARQIDGEYVDRELLVEAASRTGINLEEWAARDMRVASLTDRIAHIFQVFIERSAAGYSGDPYMSGEPLISRTYEQQATQAATPDQRLDDRRFLEVTTEIIREMAEPSHAVIIGRGAFHILKDHPRVFHLLTIAPADYRVRIIMERDQLSHDDAVKFVEEQERHRQTFIRKFFHTDPLDPSAFDMVLSTHRLSVRQHADIVVAAARSLDARVVGGM